MQSVINKKMEIPHIKLSAAALQFFLASDVISWQIY
jgi:hypothetical protein